VVRPSIMGLNVRESRPWAALLSENDLPSAVAPTGESPAMIEAFLWGALAASALLVGALIAYAVTPSQKLIAVVMALGACLGCCRDRECRRAPADGCCAR
jgi:hypothetical protein